MVNWEGGFSRHPGGRLESRPSDSPPDMGHIRITGRKNYAQTVNIYTRLRSVTAWRLLVAKRMTFPFDDQTPPAQAGVPEEREYMARGVIGDTEIGLPSDIVTATFTA